MALDTIIEEEDDGPLPEDDIDDDSGAYQGSSGRMATTSHPATRSHAHDKDENTESELIVRPFPRQIFTAWLAYLLLGYFVVPEFSRTFPSMGAPL